jgi:hypothetical protein
MEGDMTFFMNRIANPFVKLILRSPLHALLSKGVVLLSVAGRKSGRFYDVPVNYQRSGEILWVISQRDRIWWRNLRGGARIGLRLAGVKMEGWGDVIEERSQVEAALAAYWREYPGVARYYHVRMEPGGNPMMEDVQRIAQNRVVIKIALNGHG